MSVNLQVTVDSAGFAAAIQNLIEQYPDAVGRALMRVGEEIFNLSSVLVPVRTGFLKSTLGIRQTSDFSITLYASAPYGFFVEFGHFTRGHKSYVQPVLFMTRAMQQYEATIPEGVAGSLQQLADAYFG